MSYPVPAYTTEERNRANALFKVRGNRLFKIVIYNSSREKRRNASVTTESECGEVNRPWVSGSGPSDGFLCQNFVLNSDIESVCSDWHGVPTIGADFAVRAYVSGNVSVSDFRADSLVRFEPKVRPTPSAP